VFLRKITRAGTDLGKLADTIVHRGDVLTLVGSAASTTRAIETIGVANEPAEVAEEKLKAAASVQSGRILYRFITDADELTTYFRTEIANRLAKRND
jgi:putative transport protein